MIIRHSLPERGWTKIDRYVFANSEISDGAKALYGYLCGLRNGSNFSDAYIKKAMQLTPSALTRRKRELKEAGLILIDQIGPRVYVIYIGHSQLPANAVKANWVHEEDSY